MMKDLNNSEIDAVSGGGEILLDGGPVCMNGRLVIRFFNTVTGAIRVVDTGTQCSGGVPL